MAKYGGAGTQIMRMNVAQHLACKEKRVLIGTAFYTHNLGYKISVSVYRNAFYQVR